MNAQNTLNGMYHSVLNSVGDEQQHACRQRQVGVQLLEQRLELRQHVAGQDRRR